MIVNQHAMRHQQDGEFHYDGGVPSPVDLLSKLRFLAGNASAVEEGTKSVRHILSRIREMLCIVHVYQVSYQCTVRSALPLLVKFLLIKCTVFT